MKKFQFMKRGGLVAATLFVALLGASIFCAGAYGADSAAASSVATPAAAPSAGTDAAQEPEKPLKFSLSLYTWFSGVSTDLKDGDTSVSSDVPFSDIFDVLDFANFMHFEVQRGKWGLFSELDFIKLSEDTEFRKPSSGLPFKVHADGVLKQTIAELGLFRSFGGERVGFDVLAGARYFRIESDVSVGPFESNGSTDWVDPLVGGRLTLRLADQWQAWLRGDLAGFGTGSELTTHIFAGVLYNISDRYSVGFGYRYLDIDYEEDELEVDMTTDGPILGMTIRF